MHVRRRQRRDHRGGVLRSHQHGAYRTDHPQPLGGRIALLQRVEPVLRCQPVAYRRRAQRHADDAPAQVAGLQRRLEHRGLVRAVEGADAEMHHAGAHGVPIVARAADVAGQIVEAPLRQPDHRVRPPVLIDSYPAGNQLP